MSLILTTVSLFGQVENQFSGQTGFVRNMGQIANENLEPIDSIDFQLQRPGLNAYFTPTGINYYFYRTERKTEADYSPEDVKAFERGDYAEIGEKAYFYRMDFRLIGSNPDAQEESADKLSTYTNYYLSHCPQGITNVPGYEMITYKEVYENIDLVYKFQNGSLKYEFVVHPGGDVNDIRFTYDGSDNLEVSESGELNVVNGFGPFRENTPYTFYKDSGSPVRSSFVAKDGQIGFQLGDYDTSKSVVIDPTITWSTYYDNGGSSDFHANSVFDSDENIYIANATYSSSWTTINAGAGQYYDATHDGSLDLAIMRFNSDYSLQWVTYYGGDRSDVLCGTGGDYGKTMDVDDNDYLYVAGHANSSPTTFPTQSSTAPGAWYQDDSNLKGGDNSFVLKFDQNGVRQWATLYQHTNASTSGAGIRINGIKCNGTKLYFTGQTYQFSGFDIPLVSLAGAYYNATFVGNQDVFIGRFSDDCILEWSTYYNSGNVGATGYQQGSDISFDPSGNMLLAGQISTDASSVNLVNPGGGAYFSSTISGFIDHIIVKFNTSLQPTWSTIIGGTDLDRVSEISSDASGNILVVSRTARAGMPSVDPGGGAFYYNTVQSASSDDGFIMKFSPAGVYTWGTYVGGTDGNNSVSGISADNSDNIYVIGYTSSTDFPTVSSTGSYNQGTIGGGNDVVMMRFTSGGVNDWSTFYGGANSETCYGTKIDVSKIANSCGYKQFFTLASQGAGTPTTDPGGAAYFEGTYPGTNSRMKVLFEEAGTAGSTDPTGITVSQPSPCAGSNVDLTVTGGTLAGGDTYTWYEGGCGSGSSIGTGSTITVSPTTNTTYYVRAEGPCGNTNCVSTTVTVTGTGTEDASWTSPGTVCETAGSFSLTPFVTGDAGGTWSGTGVSGTNFNPTGLSGGISVTYTVGTSPCEAAETHTITVGPDVDPVWSPPSSVCEANGLVDLPTFLGTATAGGTWSGTGVSGTDFDPTGLSGSINITYTVGTSGCQENSTQGITVIPTPDPSWASPGTVCEADGSFSLTGYITGDPGGTWSGSGVSGSTFDPSGLSGAISVTYSVGTSPCTADEIQTITVNPDVDAVWTSPGTICEADGIIDLNTHLGTATPGGTWSGTGVTGSDFDPSGLSGAININYTAGAGACSENDIQTITVNPDVDPAWTNPGTVCDAGGVVNLAGFITGTTGGTWTGTGVTGSNFDPSGLSGSTVTITYTVGTSPCEEVLAQNISVESSVTANWTSPGTICADAGVIDLSTFITGSTGGTFSGTGVSGTNFDPAGLSGSYTINYSVGAGACSDSQDQTITVVPDVDPTWTDPSPVCASGGMIDLNTLITGTSGGTWAGTGVSGSMFDPSALGGQTIVITYTVGTSPCVEQLVHNVTVSSVLSAAWTAPGSVCETDSVLDLDGLITGDVGGTWSGTGVTGSSFDPSGLSGSVNITYMVGTASCGDTVTSTVNILAAPGVPTGSASVDTICAGETVSILAGGSGAGVDYDVYDSPTGGTLLGQTPINFSPTVTSTYYIEAVNSNGCSHAGARIAVVVEVLPVPVADAGTDQTICVGSTAVLTGSGGGTYSWSTSETTATIVVAPTSDALYFLTVSNGTCTDVDTVEVNVITSGTVNAVSDFSSTTSGTDVTSDLHLNDSGDPSTVIIISGPTNGMLSGSSGTYTYTPDADFVGSETVVYSICDITCTSICDTATWTIEVNSNEDVSVPGGFSPNGDGINDLLVITGLSQLEQTELTVFNRWGDMVYTASPYNNDWDGTSINALYGSVVVDGAYYYLFKYTDSAGNEEVLKGYIEIKSK